MRRFFAVLLCILTVFAYSALAESTGAVTPYVICASLKEAAGVAGFEINAPEKADGCTVTILAWKDELIEVSYNNGWNTLTVRKGKGESDVSGDYNVYDRIVTHKIGTVNITLKGNSDALRLITWSYGGYSYSIAGTTGINMRNAAAAVRQLSGIKKADSSKKGLLVGGDPRTWGPAQ